MNIRKLSPKTVGLVPLGLLSLCLIGSGCSVNLVREENLKNEPRVRFIKPNNSSVIIEYEENEENRSPQTVNVKYTDTTIEINKPCRVRYKSFYYNFLNMIAVPGRLPNGREYTVWIDSGYDGFVMTNGITILENDLAIHQLGQNSRKESLGICHLPYLEIGEVRVVNPPCDYIQIHWQFELLGLPIWKQKGVIVGLGLLKYFSYISFDNIKKEMVLSAREPFEPNEPAHWRSYPLELAESDRGSPRLMVDIPLAGEDVHIMFDTCGRYGMVVGPELWQKISAKSKDVKPRKIRFASGVLGWLPGKKAKIPKLDIAGQVVKNAEVIILDKDSPYLIEPGYISMKYFKNSVVVLDFKQKLMWVKRIEHH